MFPINFPASQTVAVDSALWKACAGTNVKVPEGGTIVYYFPEGHAEQFDSPPAFAPLVWPVFPCRVLNVRYLADRVSDEVFAAVLLEPVGSDFRGADPVPRSVVFGGRLSTGVERERSRIDSYLKVLTQSDANNGGGFSVPRQCAESIFPALNYEEDPPVQNLSIADVQGVDWVFRHIFRGTPKRHLLTTGWSKFVNHKKLIAGDTVVFMRNNLTGRLYIAIRRLDRSSYKWVGRRSLHMGVSGGAEEEIDEWSCSTGNRKVSARFVEEAAMHAAQRKLFEVILYPRNGLPDFVVNADVVDRALSLRWAVGMPVKMPVASDDDSSRSTWLRGQVSLVTNSLESGQWRGSPWKMLQVTWVEPEHLQNVERASPWQVEYAGPTTPLQPIHPPNELIEPRYFQPLIAGNREPHFMIGQGDPRSGLPDSTLFNSNTHLASMQGARHLSDVSDLIGGDTHQIGMEDMFQRSELSLFRSRITEVNPVGHQSTNVSAESHSSLRSFGTDVGNLPEPHRSISSIQLFGKLIYVNNPVECQSGDAGCLETNSSKGDNDADDVDNQSPAC
ncbi:unnamed protein product [Rhodiola kirilowii]